MLALFPQPVSVIIIDINFAAVRLLHLVERSCHSFICGSLLPLTANIAAAAVVAVLAAAVTAATVYRCTKRTDMFEQWAQPAFQEEFDQAKPRTGNGH